jgi:hypothetical protein
VATEFSSFDSSTLPAPGPATPSVPLPPPTGAAPAAPPSLPVLPPPGAPQAAPATADVATDSAEPLTAIPPVAPPGDTDPDAPSNDEKRRPPVGLLIALFAAIVVGIAGFFVLSGDSSSDGADAPPVTRPRPAADGNVAADVDSEPETAIGEILDDANDVVADINANGQEEELLAELGLDATGNPIEVADAGYRFTWEDPSGQDLDIIVDSASNDYAVVASDGISFRHIGDAYYGQSGDDGEWYELAGDPFGAIPVVGLDGIPSVDEVVPAAVTPYVVSDTVDGPSRVVMIDDAAFAAADLDARNAWLAPWGLIDETVDSASSVVVRLTFDPSGDNVVGAHIETPAIGGFAAFSITETYEVAPVIENPMSTLPVDEAAVDLGE